MSTLQLKIIKRAIKTRLAGGEVFEDIILDYPRLSIEEISEIRAEYGTEESGEE